MLLQISRQWGLAVACVCTVMVFLFILTNLEIFLPYPFQPESSPEAFAKQDVLELPELSQGTAIPSSLVEPNVVEQLPASTTSSAEAVETGFRKTIVMGKMSDENTDWVEDELKDWQRAIYTVDLAANESSPTGLKTAVNKAKEATPYLTYIVDNYDTFPDVAVFIHSHRRGYPAAWHNDAKGLDAVSMLNQLKTEIVVHRGYVNLRCINEPGCPSEIDLNRPVDPSKHAEIAYPYLYAEFFNMTVEDVRKQVSVVATQCCAQFAVSREQVLQRPRAEYARYLQLIRYSEYDDQTLGTVMEYMWHIIFGRDAVHCEDQYQCWSIVYGRPKGWSNWD